MDVDYDGVEWEIKQEIKRQFNEYLCEQEMGELKMELFLLEK